MSYASLFTTKQKPPPARLSHPLPRKEEPKSQVGWTYEPVTCDIGRHEPLSYNSKVREAQGDVVTKTVVQREDEAPSDEAQDVESTKPLPPSPSSSAPTMWLPTLPELEKRITYLCTCPEDSPELVKWFPSLFGLRHIRGVPELFSFQRVAMPQILRTIGIQQNNGLLIAPTGSGKTYIYAHAIEMLRWYYPERFGNGKVVLVVTKPSIIIQTTRVIQQQYRHRDVWVTSYDQLRSTLGELFLDWEDKVLENGDVVKWPVWTQYAKDLFGMVIFDECQSLKNEGSIQTRIALSLANAGIPTLLGSATPYSRPMHVRAVVALVKPYYVMGGSNRVTNRTYPSWLSELCGTKDPADWSPSTMRRIQEAIEPFTIRIGKVKYKHKTIIKQVMVDFSTPEKSELYAKAFEEYQQELIKRARDPLTGFAAVLVAMLKFQQKSELLRTDELADLAVDLDRKKGKSVIIACRFNDTLRVIRNILIKRYGYKETQISVVVGGQPAQERQRNIDAFQSDDNHVMLLMFQAGGAGLSLHQYEGCNKRPRHAILPPVWNAEEMVQVLGRAHRCNSDSTTHQWVVWYRRTIEEQVANKLKRKLASMKEVVRTRETWVDLYQDTAHNGGVTIDVGDAVVAQDKKRGADDSEEDEGVGDVEFDIEAEEE